MAFAGIRPNELVADVKKKFLQVKDIDFENKKITIPGSVSKIRKMRILENLPENLWAWIEPLRGAKKICGNYEQSKKVKSKLPVKLKKDTLRHSFATYAYYYLGAEHAVDILGHDFKTYQKFYKGLTNKENSEKYFSIMP